MEEQLENMNLLPNIKTKIQDLLPMLRKIVRPEYDDSKDFNRYSAVIQELTDEQKKKINEEINKIPEFLSQDTDYENINIWEYIFDRKKGLLVKLYQDFNKKTSTDTPIPWHLYQPSPHDVAKSCKYYNDKFVESSEKSKFKIVHVKNKKLDKLNESEPKWGSLAHMLSIGINIEETSNSDPVLQEISDNKFFSLGTVLSIINKVNIDLNITEFTKTLKESSIEINKLLYDFYLYDTDRERTIDTVQVDFLAKIVSLLIDLIKYAIVIFENLDKTIDQIHTTSINITQQGGTPEFWNTIGEALRETVKSTGTLVQKKISNIIERTFDQTNNIKNELRVLIEPIYKIVNVYCRPYGINIPLLDKLEELIVVPI